MRTRGTRGFTIVDVLVSVSVVAVLVGLMMPSLSKVRETARRVACSSNVRQHGLGLAMYSDDYRDALPPSRYSMPRSPDSGQWHKMSTVRVAGTPGDWDGLGWLYALDYLRAPGVFYCPSHTGEHPYSSYVQAWRMDEGEIISNYHYRGFDSTVMRGASAGSRLSLVTDSLRTQDDYSHQAGSNVLRTDLSVIWFDDSGGSVLASLPETFDDEAAPLKIEEAWEAIDLIVPDMSPTFNPDQGAAGDK